MAALRQAPAAPTRPLPGHDDGQASFDGIVCLSPDRLGDMKRPEQLMRRLAGRNPVLYVEAPVHIAALLRHPIAASRDSRWSQVFGRSAREIEPGLWVYTPVAIVPRHYLLSWPLGLLGDLLVNVQDRFWAAGVRRACTQSGILRPALWFAEPRRLNGLQAISAHTIYDCVDRWLGFPGPMRYARWRRRIQADEETLLRRAGTVFCTAQGLLGDKRRLSSVQPVLLRNGADVAHFGKALDPATPAAPDLRGLRHPVVGYVGALAAWVDFALLRDVASARPDWEIVLIGPQFEGAISGADDTADRIAELENVHVLGARPYETLPGYLKEFDAAIIPFKVNGLTEDTNPIKLYEYLGAGLPVVSTPLPEVSSVDEVSVAGSAAEFVRAVERGIAERHDEPSQRRRVRIAEENSWDARAHVAWQTLLEGAAAAQAPAAQVDSVPGRSDESLTGVRAEGERPPARSALPLRPRTLVVATDLPWPLNSGWRIRAFENLRAISEFSDVTLIAFAESDDPSKDVASLAEALPGVRVLDPVPLRIHIKEHPLLLLRAALRGLFTGRPYKIAKFGSSQMRSRLAALRETAEFDIVHAELATIGYAGLMRHGGDGRGPRVVLDEHNVESELLLDHWRRGEFGVLSPAVRLECARTRRYEARACARADLVLTISDEDRLALSALSGAGAHIVTAPPVAGPLRPVRPSKDPAEPIALFVGQLSWLPNQEAVRWLCDEVVPAVKASSIPLRWQVVGGGAPAALVELMRASGVEPLGYVDDLDSAYAMATVFVAPFLTGGGVRVKLLEAMCEGVPIVTTTAGAKGLAVTGGIEMLVGDTPDRFTDALEALVSDAELRERIAESARAYIAAHHSHEAAVITLREAYGALVWPRPPVVSEAVTPEPEAIPQAVRLS